MVAIIKREVQGYFTSPIGYFVVLIFYLIAGLFFYSNNLMAVTTNMAALYNYIVSLTAVLIPILTMRLFSEEKRQKTEQALLTAPVTIFSIVFAKLISAFLIYVMMISITLVYAVILSAAGTPDWAVVFGQYIGLALLGLALISIGIFISALTESQMIAAIGSYAVTILLMLVPSLAAVVPSDLLAEVLRAMAIYGKYSLFSYGIISLDNVVYLLSITSVFVYLTIRIFEKRRWS